MPTLECSKLAPLVAAAALLVQGCARGPKPVVAPVRGMEVPVIDRVLPRPATIVPGDGVFTVAADTAIVFDPADPEAARQAAWLTTYIRRATGLQLASAPSATAIRVATRPGPNPEGYELTVDGGGITLTGAGPAGLFYGMQSLRQLMPAAGEYEALLYRRPRPFSIPAVRITDAPRFAWRGAMLDVARHFFPIEDVKRYVDLLALHKFNRLHLHLADDQGWRIEIKSHPELTRVGGASEVGGGPGGFYTQEEFADLVAYAAARFITIVPEIDLPGHTNAALASIPELNCDGVARPPYTGTEVGFSTVCVERESTYAFIDDVVRELAALTPGGYFHAGGDEVKKLSAAQYNAFVTVGSSRVDLQACKLEYSIVSPK